MPIHEYDLREVRVSVGNVDLGPLARFIDTTKPQPKLRGMGQPAVWISGPPVCLFESASGAPGHPRRKALMPHRDKAPSVPQDAPEVKPSEGATDSAPAAQRGEQGPCERKDAAPGRGVFRCG